MFTGIRWPMISSSFLRLSHRSFIIFPSLFLILLSILSWVPLVQLLFDGARPNFDRSACGPRWRILQPLPFHPPLLPLLQRVVWLLRSSWHSFSAWMLALILSLLSCIALEVSPLLHLFHLLRRLLRTRMLMMVLVMMMRMRMLALPVMMRRLLSDLHFVIRDKKGE